MSSGHGWVTPLPNGAKARCGGPALCTMCAKELADQRDLRARRIEQAARALWQWPVSLVRTAPPATAEVGLPEFVALGVALSEPGDATVRQFPPPCDCTAGLHTTAPTSFLVEDPDDEHAAALVRRSLTHLAAQFDGFRPDWERWHWWRCQDGSICGDLPPIPRHGGGA